MSGTALDLSQIRTDALDAKPTFRALIGVDIASFATAAEGELAATALQPSDIASGTITPKTGDLDLNALAGLTGTGSTDNAVLRADGTNGNALQSSGVTISDNNEVLIVSGSPTAKPLCVRGAASQTGNLTEWQNSAGTVVIYVTSAGEAVFTVLSYFTAGVQANAQFRSNLAGNATNPNLNFVQGGGSVCGIYGAAGGVQHVGVVTNAQDSFRVDANAVPGNVRLLLWDVSKGSLQRVSVGANDSGGTGFKVLRIPN